MKRLVMLAAPLVVMATTVTNAQSVDPTRALSGGRVAWDSVRLPAATAADTTLTRHAVLVRYANCAAWVVDTVFVDVLPIGAEGSGNPTVPRVFFWACVSHEGWPSEIRSADFVGSPENWVESIFRSSDTVMQSLSIVFGMALLDDVELNIEVRCAPRTALCTTISTTLSFWQWTPAIQEPTSAPNRLPSASAASGDWA